MSFKKVVSNRIFTFKRKYWINRLRKRVINPNFTLISNNCCAGVIYKDLGIQFLSPTINLYFDPNEYLLFVKNIKSYLEGEMVEAINGSVSFPVGKIYPTDLSIPTINVYFMHYKNYNEAYDAWTRRCKRVNYENIFFLWEYNKENTKHSDIQEFDKLSINKMIFSYDSYDDIKYYHHFCFAKKFIPGEIVKILPSGKRNLDEFDYVSFIMKKQESNNF